MSLPKKMERVIAKIATQSEIEAKLLPIFIKRLNRNLTLLESLAGSSCAKACYVGMMKCVFKEGSHTCLEWYEEHIMRCLTERLRRPLSEAEEQMVSQVVDEVVDVTEILLGLGGVALIDPEDEEGEAQGGPPAPARTPPPRK